MGYDPSPFAVIDAFWPLLKNELIAWPAGRAVRQHGPHRCIHQHMETTMNFDKEYDASGLACPLPIVKTKKALADMSSGQVLKVLATDPGSVCDMAAFAEQTGNDLVEQGNEGGKYVFFLKKA
jgi:tRNA 2-thiouridine synthesizing protein A